MKTFVASAVFALCIVSIATADKFNAYITKVEDNTVYYKKKLPKAKGGNWLEEKADAILGVKTYNSVINYHDYPPTRLEATEEIAGGLKNEVFSKISDKGMFAELIINDFGKITQVVVGPSK
ncbi:MAG TPA: hypothetical protein VE988_26760 [Gemmataceae bacterium]|nr:hypothetical protein [Gemmataceae bacterium]